MIEVLIKITGAAFLDGVEDKYRMIISICMDCPENVKRTINDTEKGAAELTRELADKVSELTQKETKECMETALKARYNMTPVVNLVNEFFLSLEKGEDCRERLKEYSRSIHRNRERTARAVQRIIERKGYPHILTLSYSSTVIEALEKTEKVTVLESSPRKEGRKTGELLFEEGGAVQYWVDAAMYKALEGIDAVVIGADTVTSEGFLNKIGSAPLTLSAEEKGVPVYAAADSSKILPEYLPIPEGEEHPAEEVWSTDIDIDVHNDYFEFSPWRHAQLVTEDGLQCREKIKQQEEKRIAEQVENIHPLL